MTTTFKTILLNTSSKGVTTLLLNRPRQKNAINIVMYNEIKAALREVSAAPQTKAIIITGSGDYYSSGNDLSNFSQLMHPRTMASQAKNILYDFVDAFISCEKPITAAVNGPAIGIAVTVLGLCDRRICVPTATFSTPFKALGQAPEGCSSYTFPKLLGESNAKRLLDDGEKITAVEAKRIGLVDAVYSNIEEMMMEAMSDANTATVQVIKSNRKDDMLLLSQLREVNKHECDVLEKAWVSPECFEALATYLDSRNKRGHAFVLRAMNKLKFIWDR